LPCAVTAAAASHPEHGDNARVLKWSPAPQLRDANCWHTGCEASEPLQPAWRHSCEFVKI